VLGGRQESHIFHAGCAGVNVCVACVLVVHLCPYTNVVPVASVPLPFWQNAGLFVAVASAGLARCVRVVSVLPDARKMLDPVWRRRGAGRSLAGVDRIPIASPMPSTLTSMP